MASQLDRLSGILDLEGETLASLVALSEQEREALARRDLTALTRCTEAKERSISRMATLEKQRVESLTGLAQQAGLEEAGPSLVDLARLLDPVWRKRLLSQRERVLAQVEALSQIDRANRALFEAALSLTEDCIGFLVALQRPETVYGDGGQTRGAVSPRASILDARA